LEGGELGEEAQAADDGGRRQPAERNHRLVVGEAVGHELRRDPAEGVRRAGGERGQHRERRASLGLQARERVRHEGHGSQDGERGDERAGLRLEPGAIGCAQGNRRDARHDRDHAQDVARPQVLPGGASADGEQDQQARRQRRLNDGQRREQQRDDVQRKAEDRHDGAQHPARPGRQLPDQRQVQREARIDLLGLAGLQHQAHAEQDGGGERGERPERGRLHLRERPRSVGLAERRACTRLGRGGFLCHDPRFYSWPRPGPGLHRTGSMLSRRPWQASVGLMGRTNERILRCAS